jgi:hypothetical protein
MKRLMFKNSDSDNNIEIEHTRSGRAFREVPLVNIFEQIHKPTQEEGFYSGEEEELLNEERSWPAREEEENTEEIFQEDSETSKNVQTIEVNSITPPVVSTTLSNQSNLSYQNTQRTGTSGSVHTQSENLGRSMADEMRLPTFRGYGFEDLDQHSFLCEAIWSIKNVTDEDVKRAWFSTTLRDCALSWYMTLV